MKPEEQRIAIAEARGYLLAPLPQNPNQKTWQKNGLTTVLPDYLNDLNACHEFENTLSIEGFLRYHSFLRYIVLRLRETDCPERVISATAAQRAEAFLKTIGKWKDND